MLYHEITTIIKPCVIFGNSVWRIIPRVAKGLNFINVDDSNTFEFLNWKSSHSLIPLVSKPIRITDEIASLIDNIFTFCSINFTAEVLITNISDHLPIFLIDEYVFVIANGHQETTKKTNIGLLMMVIIELMCWIG